MSSKKLQESLAYVDVCHFVENGSFRKKLNLSIELGVKLSDPRLFYNMPMLTFILTGIDTQHGGKQLGMERSYLYRQASVFV